MDAEVNLGDFLNEYAANSSAFWALLVGAIFSLLIFGYFYNRLMDHLKDDDEHTSLYVAIGVAVTVGSASLFSWKAGLLMLVFFAASGTPMIFGEFQRTKAKVDEKKHTPRRKRLPYAANGRIDDAAMCVKEASRLLGMCLKEKDGTARALQIATASHELNDAQVKLLELKMIQQIEE
jgi:hypothetical protein